MPSALPRVLGWTFTNSQKRTAFLWTDSILRSKNVRMKRAFFLKLMVALSMNQDPPNAVIFP